jgi:hypothetical protein
MKVVMKVEPMDLTLAEMKVYSMEKNSVEKTVVLKVVMLVAMKVDY